MTFLDSKNVITGAASVYLSAQDSTQYTSAPALPTFTSATPSAPAFAAASATWRNVGFTKDGVEVQYAPTYGEVEVDQLLDSAKLFRQQLKVTCLTNMVEASLENLLVAWGQPTQPGTTSIDILPGALGDEPIERALCFVGNSPKTVVTGVAHKNERVYYVTRAIVDQSTNHMLRRSEATTFPVAFRLLPDTSQSNSRYGQVFDRNVT
jgi:hypothetical protein